jgi:hypothetical protein
MNDEISEKLGTVPCHMKLYFSYRCSLLNAFPICDFNSCFWVCCSTSTLETNYEPLRPHWILNDSISTCFTYFTYPDPHAPASYLDIALIFRSVAYAGREMGSEGVFWLFSVMIYACFTANFHVKQTPLSSCLSLPYLYHAIGIHSYQDRESYCRDAYAVSSSFKIFVRSKCTTQNASTNYRGV